MKAFAILSVLAVALLAGVNADGHNVFCYRDPKCAPEHWEGACKTGTKQSPVDIDLKSTLTAKTAAVYQIEFNEEYKEDLANVRVENNGHSVQYSLNAEATSDLNVTLTVEGNKKITYTFAQLHVHTKSEHSVNGELLPVEAHLVHYRSDLGSVSAAAAKNDADGLLVLGVFFNVTGNAQDSAAFEPIIKNLVADPKSTKTCSDSVNLYNLLPVSNANLVSKYDVAVYEGSLTTPGCNEIVRWFVFTKPVPITQRQLDAFAGVKDAENKPLQNNRPVQNLNGRVVKQAQVIEKKSMSGVFASFLSIFG